MTAVATVFDTAAARRQMVESQLRPNRVLDPRIVAAMGDIPRELFVPERLAGVAYVDEDLEITPGRFLMEPRVLGRLLEALDVQSTHRVLEIGSGCGYATAVLARLAARVVALEVDGDLATRASRLLSRLDLNNTFVAVGSLAAGEPSRAPYDRILLSGAAEDVPEALKAQLVDGGRLAGVFLRGGVGKATVVERHGQAFGVREVFDASTPILPGLTRVRGFVF
ncbi:MAG: protein-L-isoaspartate O-methyltransferase [Alphaproteobacteria bacterium]|nr:protein-L-isoaspartate O-methyltransferase [Alphaproteobacteria bacterium]